MKIVTLCPVTFCPFTVSDKVIYMCMNESVSLDHIIQCGLSNILTFQEINFTIYCKCKLNASEIFLKFSNSNKLQANTFLNCIVESQLVRPIVILHGIVNMMGESFFEDNLRKL